MRNDEPARTRFFTDSIAAGAQITNTVDLGEFYDLSQSGRYEIAYRVAAYGLFDDRSTGSSRQGFLESWVISIKIDGRAAKGKPSPPATGGFTACSTTQQTQLIVARTDAKTYATNAASYLNAGSEGARGQTGAKSLAATDPDSAIRNADSHEYFAENTPAAQT